MILKKEASFAYLRYLPKSSEKIIKRLFNLVIRIISEVIPVRICYKILREKFTKAETFSFNRTILNYFYHSYRNHRLSERSIEIPIIRNYIEKAGIRNFLEIGNVTNHYYSYFQELIDSKVVVDKHEIGWGVINQDIIEYFPKKKFDFICSISTFEHMDSDRGRNPDYIKGKSKYDSYAADNLVHICTNLLKSEGLLIITTPIGYSDEWDRTLFSREIMNVKFLNVKSLKIFYFRRLNEIEWKQTNFYGVKNAKYNHPYPRANALSIIEIRK